MFSGIQECPQKAAIKEEELSWEDADWDNVTLPASKRTTAEDDVILLQDKLSPVSTPSVSGIIPILFFIKCVFASLLLHFQYFRRS